MRVVKPWPRLPREVVEVPSLEPLQARLDGDLSTLIQLQMSLLAAGGWDQMTCKVASNPKHPVMLWFYFCCQCGYVSTDLFVPLIPFRVMGCFIKLDHLDNILCLFRTINCGNSEYTQSLWQTNSFNIDWTTFQKYTLYDFFLYSETLWMWW